MHAHTLVSYTDRQYIDEVIGQERVHEAKRTCVLVRTLMDARTTAIAR